MHKHRGWRPTNGRSRAFQEYLSQQPPERQRAILAGEQGYLRAVDNPTGSRVAIAIAFADSLKGPTPQTLDPAAAM